MFKFTLANLSKCTWIPACWRKSCCAWGQWAGIWFRVSWTPLSNCHTFRRCQIEESLILTGSTPVSNHPCSLQGLCSNMSQALHHFELNMWHGWYTVHKTFTSIHPAAFANLFSFSPCSGCLGRLALNAFGLHFTVFPCLPWLPPWLPWLSSHWAIPDGAGVPFTLLMAST